MKTILMEASPSHLAAGSHLEMAALWDSEQRELVRRTEQILREEIPFIPHPSFRRSSVVAEILAVPLPPLPRQVTLGDEKVKKKYSSEVSRLCSTPLLSAEEERVYFRRLNCLRFRANQLRRRLSPSQPDRELLDEISRLLSEAHQTKQRIVSANVRLVVSIVKQLGVSRDVFEELLSDGLLALMRAAEKFDFDRGYRFSTYATMVIRRQLYRGLKTDQRGRSRIVLSDPTTLNDVPQSNEGSQLSCSNWQTLELSMGQMLRELDPRERQIIRGRFGFDTLGRKQTLQSLATEMGVCKERVRQLEQRAMKKLQKMAEQFSLQGLLD